MITSLQNIHNSVQSQKSNRPSSGQEIMGGFEKMLNEVNQDQLQADSMIADLAAGQQKDIPGTIVAMEKAETSLKMLMSVRNKAISAYEEIMRMQV